MKPSVITSVGRSYYTIICGLILVTLGIALTFAKTWILQFVLPEIVLKPNSIIEEFWKKIPVKIPTNVYLFNWTNPEDVSDPSINPKFQQLGPYRFLLNMEKVNVIWNDNNTVTYNQLRTWHFDEDYPSNGNLSDSITQINFLTMLVAHKVRYWNYFTKASISSLMSLLAPTVHVTKTAREILFESHDNAVRDTVKSFSFLAPELPDFKEFGVFNFRNGSTEIDGVINMGTGVGGNFDIFNWNYYNETSAFQGQCAKMRGSIGELHSPIQNRNNLYIFYPDICRTIAFEYEKDVVIDGVLGYKYSIGNKICDDGALIPENKCYCSGECMPFGVVNVSSCRYGLPIYGSLPNFYKANPEELHLDGLQAEKSKHETFVVVEPNTGVPLKAVLRVQINTMLHPVEGLAVYENVPKRFMPLIWTEMEIRLPDQLQHLLKMYIGAPLVYNIIVYGLMTVGVCVLALSLVCKMLCVVAVYTIRYGQKQSISLKPEEVPLQNVTRTSL